MKKNEKQIYTVLDANCNRLREACRVCEDIARFVIADTTLTAAFKKLRHQVTKEILQLPVTYRSIVETRTSETDCGRTSFIIDKKKENITDVFIKNMKRAQEAARVIEEFVKLLDQKSARNFQKIRFSFYDLEKKAAQKF